MMRDVHPREVITNTDASDARVMVAPLLHKTSINFSLISPPDMGLTSLLMESRLRPLCAASRHRQSPQISQNQADRHEDKKRCRKCAGTAWSRGRREPTATNAPPAAPSFG